MQQTLGPAIAYGLGFAAAIARMSRGTLLEVIRDDYIRTARAKGLGEGLVMWRHALKNAVIPVITLSGLQLAAVMGGSVAMERAFSVPGLGFTLVEAISFRDYWLIQNLVLVFGVAYVLVNLAIDLTYGWLDPRIRYS
jgi:ABC-type dipeptide/oligopeptide/nickel transport system permease component